MAGGDHNDLAWMSVHLHSKMPGSWCLHSSARANTSPLMTNASSGVAGRTEVGALKQNMFYSPREPATEQGRSIRRKPSFIGRPKGRHSPRIGKGAAQELAQSCSYNSTQEFLERDRQGLHTRLGILPRDSLWASDFPGPFRGPDMPPMGFGAGPDLEDSKATWWHAMTLSVEESCANLQSKETARDRPGQRQTEQGLWC